MYINMKISNDVSFTNTCSNSDPASVYLKIIIPHTAATAAQVANLVGKLDS